MPPCLPRRPRRRPRTPLGWSSSRRAPTAPTPRRTWRFGTSRRPRRTSATGRPWAGPRSARTTVSPSPAAPPRTTRRSAGRAWPREGVMFYPLDTEGRARVRCAACGTENRPDRKFCSQCGAGLALACVACGAANLPGERFCGECGRPLETSAAAQGSHSVDGGSPAVTAPGAATGAAPSGAERRLVSVLFVDLVGSTTIAETRDAETVRELLGDWFEAARAIIDRYGGTVEKFIGDAVMAVWGAPSAHEDDAERAVRAALEIVTSVPRLAPDTDSLQARAGVLTGEAAITVGLIGQGMIAGDLVNTASRLQSIATPGTVLVGDATYRAASRSIAFEEAGQRELKGKELPVQLWRAVSVVAKRGGEGRAATLEPPFVGRDDELSQLKDLFHATARDGKSRLVTLSGVAGIGKSRLLWELEKYLDGVVDLVYWHG